MQETASFNILNKDFQFLFKCKHSLLKQQDCVANALHFHIKLVEMLTDVHKVVQFQEPLGGIFQVLISFRQDAKQLSTFPLDNQRTLLCKISPG